MCDTIDVQLVSHLYNRMTGADIVRTASLVISNADAKYSENPVMIDTGNIYTWKIVNKTAKTDVTVQAAGTTNASTYLREYYDATNLVIQASDDTTAYTQGQMILKLHRESHNYVLRLYNVSESGSRVPYSLTGAYSYYLVFPTTGNSKVKIAPTVTSDSTDLGIGAMLFYISEANVKTIMAVDEDVRYFALVCDNGSSEGTTTTLYEGKVEYYS